MTAPIFVDTNVFIYSLDSSDISKQRAAQIWLAALWNSRTGRISFQVLQELYVKIVHRMPAARDQARAEIRDLLAWRPISPSANTLEQAWKIQNRYRFSFWDSLIVAAAAEGGCEYLLTEDLQAGQVLEGMKVVNPFALAPDAIGLADLPE